MKWNVERVLCFMSMILQVSHNIKRAANVRRRLKEKMIEWEESKYQLLTSSIGICTEAKTNSEKEPIKIKERAKIFSSLIRRGGGIRAAVRYACERENGGIIIPGDTYEKTGGLVGDTLKQKHSEGTYAVVENCPLFDSCVD